MGTDLSQPNRLDHRPLVSVIIPAFNAERYLAGAIDSALSQTYPNLEVIVINDGSTDRTGEIARKFGNRVLVIDQENRGIAGARNSGIRKARGSVIALLDADDRWMHDRLDRCVDLLLSNPEVGFVTTDAFLLEDGIETEKRWYGDYGPSVFPEPADQLDAISIGNFVFVSVVFDRRLLNVVGRAFDESTRAAEDFGLWSAFLLAGAIAGLVPEPLAWYDVRSDSVSRARQEQWTAHLHVLEEFLPRLWLRGHYGRPRDAFQIGVALVERGERRMGLWFLAHALKDPGSSLFQRARMAAAAGVKIARGR